jgi:NADPH:quinone reductase-like Zn-dependent oxidoreductase
MKSIRIHSFGGSDVLQLDEAPAPRPAAGQVLIQVRAAGVNPVDGKIRSGSFRKAETRLPAALGRDVAGVVEAVGAGVKSLDVGDDVYAFLGEHSGGYSEYALADEQEVARKPVSLDYVQAAAVPLAATTAWQALFDHGHLQRGQRVLIHGGAGGVGNYAIQFAKVRGARVFTTGKAEDGELLRSLGADEVIDYESERFEERARDMDLVIDLIGGEIQARSWTCVRDGGALVSTLEKPSEKEAAARHARTAVFMAKPTASQLSEIAGLIDDGKVRVVIEATYPLAEARDAHDRLEHEHTQGKIVLTV